MLDRLRSGDGEAYAEAAARFSREIWVYIYRMCGDRELASDICQETTVALWRSAPEFDRIQSIRSWVYRTAHNTFVDTVRKSHIKTVALYDLIEDSRTKDAAKAKAQNEALNSALAALPESTRAAVLLTKVHGMTCAEAGRILNTPTGTVKWWVSEGLKSLRKALAGEEI